MKTRPKDVGSAGRAWTPSSPSGGWRQIAALPAERAGRGHRRAVLFPAAVPAELPADIANELASAAGSDWSTLRPRISERMAAGIGAYERERYRDASRILKTVRRRGSQRTLRCGSWWRSASTSWAFGRPPFPTWRPSPPYRIGRHAPGAHGLPPGSRPAQEGRGAVGRATPRVTRPRGPDRGPPRPGRHTGRQRGPDRGHRPPGRGGSRPPGPEPGRTPPPPVVRAGRSHRALGDLPRARELFLRIAAVDPDAYDVSDRLESLGPPTRSRRKPNGPRRAR